MSSSFPFSGRAVHGRLSFSFIVFAACLQAHAQGPAPSQSLGEVTVTGNPLGTQDPVAAATSISGPALLLRSRATLGQTLDGEPGVSSSYFGPSASRPVIRGLEGDRIRILNNGLGTSDVSGLSQDHAVSLDPLSAERIEVLRGPGALLYGGSAVGGVVNVIDNRIARQPNFGPEGGLGGKIDLSGATGNRERAAGFMLEGGNQRMQWHIDAFDRSAGDTAAPVNLACNKDGVSVVRRRICNSGHESQGGALGLSWFGTDSQVGASVSSYRSRYGVVAEDDVTIGMRADRYALQGEVLNLGTTLRSLRWSLGHSDYAHTEFEGAETGARFATRASEARLEARHATLGGWDGVVGLQFDAAKFSPSAPEAEDLYAPPSRRRQSAVFVHEERAMSWGKLSAGARIERVSAQSPGVDERFEPGRREFTPVSLATGLQLPVTGAWVMSSNVSYTERAPQDHELFAAGPHLATASYDIGNPRLGMERSLNMDLGARWRSGPNRFMVTGYVSRFSNFITALPTGNARQVHGEDVAELRYAQVPAQLRGLELSGNRRLLSGHGTLDLGLRGDLVRAENRDTGEPLPRVAPARVGATLTWAKQALSLGLGADHAAAQRRVPLVADGERVGATSAYTLWHATATYRQRAGKAQLLWYARLDNLTDALAYSASSVLTATVPGRAPLPGRSLRAGLQLSF